MEHKKQLDCLYGCDFFRRPQIFREVIDILELVLKGNRKSFKSMEDTRKYVNLYQDLINGHQNKIDKTLSGQEIKKVIYDERLLLLKKL